MTTRQTLAIVLFAALLSAYGSPAFAQRRTASAADPYTTSLAAGWDFFSHASDANSAIGFNADVTQMIGGFASGGGWGAGGGVDFERFSGSTLKEFEGFVHAQGKATGRKELNPFGRIGLGLNSVSGSTDMLLDFRGGVDFKLQPDAKFLIRGMVSIKRIFFDVSGETVTRFSVGAVFPLADKI